MEEYKEEFKKVENKRRAKMSREEMNKKKKKIKKIFFTILIIFVLCFAAYKINDYIIFDKNEKTNLVINNKNVTANLKKDILIENGEIYISKQDLGNFFDKYIYEDKQNNQIITTYENKIAAISLTENKIIINGSTKTTYAHAIQKGETIYIPINELIDVYGLEVKNIEESKVLTLDSTSKEQKKAIVSGDVAVKATTGFISKTVDRARKGSYAVVISDDGSNAKIRTENGKIGYVKSGDIANTVVVREEIKEEKQIDGKVNLVWDYFSMYGKAPNRSGEKMEGVNVVSPAFFYLDSKGVLQSNIGPTGQAYIEWAHNNGYKVWPMVQNAGDGMLSVTSEIMNDYNKREELINEIVTACVRYNLDGVNIDFENMKQADKDLFSRFIIELTPRIKNMGLVVSVDVTAPDGSETWSLCFDRHVIGDVADYIVFMAYDEYGASSNKAGTTAGYDWVNISLNKFLNTEAIKSEKIILAIPLYTRLWTEDGDGNLVKQGTVAIKNLDNVIPNGVEKQWNDSLKQYYIEFQDGKYTKKMWIEDETSLKEKIKLINNNNLGGVGAWAKDMEPQNFWTFLAETLDF